MFFFQVCSYDKLKHIYMKLWAKAQFFWSFKASHEVLYGDLKKFANSQLSVTNFKSFSRSLEQFFLTEGQKKFRSKIPILFIQLEVKEILRDYVLEIRSHYLSGLKWVNRLANSFYNCLLVPFDDIVKPTLAEKSTTQFSALSFMIILLFYFRVLYGASASVL